MCLLESDLQTVQDDPQGLDLPRDGAGEALVGGGVVFAHVDLLQPDVGGHTHICFLVI